MYVLSMSRGSNWEPPTGRWPFIMPGGPSMGAAPWFIWAIVAMLGFCIVTGGGEGRVSRALAMCRCAQGGRGG